MKTRYLKMEEIHKGDRFRIEIGDLSELKTGILSKGLIQPITVDEDFNLIAGGRRLQAYKELAGEEPDNKYIKKGIPVIIRAVENEVDARELELMENIHRKDMEWWEEVNLIKSIHDMMIEKNPKSGSKKWSMHKTANLLGKSLGTISDSYELAHAFEPIPELKKLPTKDAARRNYKRILETALVKNLVKENEEKLKEEASGTDQTIGQVRFIQAEQDYKIGDALEGLSRAKEGSFQFAEVDPPYGVDLQSEKSKGTAGISEYNEIDQSEYPEFIRSVATKTFRVLNADSWCVWWFGPTWHQTVLETLREVGFHVDDIPAIWYKSDSGAVANNPEMYLARTYEPFFICRKGEPVLRKRGRPNTFAFKPVTAQKKVHPTERPVELIQEILATFVFPGARIVVPFLGSGNTLIAAYKEGTRMQYGWDLSEYYKNRFLAKVQFMFGEMK